MLTFSKEDLDAAARGVEPPVGGELASIKQFAQPEVVAPEPERSSDELVRPSTLQVPSQPSAKPDAKGELRRGHAELCFWDLVDRPVTEQSSVLVPPAQVGATTKQVSAASGGYEYLGEALVRQQMLSRQDLAALLVEQQTTFERLGEIAVRKGLCSASQIDAIVERQRADRKVDRVLRAHRVRPNHIRSAMMRIEGRGESIHDVMRDTRYLSEERVAQTIAALHQLQYFPSEAMDRMELASLAEDETVSIQKFDGYLPIAKLKNGTLVMAVSDPSQTNDAHNGPNSKLAQFPKAFVVAPARAIHKAFCTYFANTEGVLLSNLTKAEDMTKAAAAAAGGREPEADDGYVKRVVGHILRHGCYTGASDIHMTESQFVAKIAMRHDGVMKDVAVYGRPLHKQIQNVIKQIGIEGINAKDGQKTLHEGTLRFKKDDKIQEEFSDILSQYGFRLEFGNSVHETTTSVIRIGDTYGATADMDNLHLDADTLADLRRCIHSANGLILLVGPTGSGKTTTLYACLGDIDAEQKSIQSIENPVESVNGNWKQYQTEHTNQALQGLMRNDPDIVLIGEIRNSEVAKTAIEGAKTGHLVLSTLHTNRAHEAPSRLWGLGIEPGDLADNLLAVMAQRLPRKLCVACATPDTRPATATAMKRALDSYLGDIVRPAFKTHCGTGCKECRFTGYRGRTAIYELIVVNAAIRELIEVRAPTSAIKREAMAPGKSMHDRGLRLVALGVTSIDEIDRELTDY